MFWNRASPEKPNSLMWAEPFSLVSKPLFEKVLPITSIAVMPLTIGPLPLLSWSSPVT